MLLVVDDDPEFLEQARQTFVGYMRVLLALDGEHALRLLNAVGADFSVALVDLDLPKIDGFQLIAILRKAAPELPIIAISGVLQQHILESAKQVGAVETLRKPITPEWKTTLDRVRIHKPGSR